jgi:large subunit ribosomal protein L5
MIPRLKEKYKNEIIKNLMSKLNYKNIYAVPNIVKVVIKMG